MIISDRDDKDNILINYADNNENNNSDMIIIAIILAVTEMIN